MSDPQRVFLDLLQQELERVVIPDPASGMARNTSVLAARQLRRLLVDRTVVPALRGEAIAAYRALLPALQPFIDSASRDRLSQALAAAEASNWGALETALGPVASALIARGDSSANQLASQLLAIDAHLRERKEQACTESNQKAQAQSVGTQSSATQDDDEPAKLLAFIQRRFPKETALRIATIKTIPGGFSKQTLFVDLENTVELPAALVMRRDAPYLTTGSSVTMEFPVIQKMFDAGVAVPQPFALDADGEVYGRPFILVARMPGRNIGDFVTVKEPSREAALDLAKKMARMHAVPIDGLSTLLAGGTVTLRERMLGLIEQHELMWKGTVNRQAYVFQVALDWLRRNVDLADGPRCVSHNDIGVHNMLVHDNAVTAFLDWETCAVGTPAEDIGYVCCTVSQMIDWDEFLAAYERAAGVVLNRKRIDYYMLWASVRVGAGIARLTDPVFSGERVNLAEYYLGDYFGDILMQRIATKLSQVLA